MEESDKHSFDDDVGLLDRYQSFSGEVLRLALLSLGAIGFLLTTAQKNEKGDAVLSLEAKGVRPLFVVAIICLSLSICCSLVHRYYSTDSMAWHLDKRRREKPAHIEKATRARDRAFDISTWSIFAAPALLTIGAAAVAIAFSLALLESR